MGRRSSDVVPNLRPGGYQVSPHRVDQILHHPRPHVDEGYQGHVGRDAIWGGSDCLSQGKDGGQQAIGITPLGWCMFVALVTVQALVL